MEMTVEGIETAGEVGKDVEIGTEIHAEGMCAYIWP